MAARALFREVESVDLFQCSFAFANFLEIDPSGLSAIGTQNKGVYSQFAGFVFSHAGSDSLFPLATTIFLRALSAKAGGFFDPRKLGHSTE